MNFKKTATIVAAAGALTALAVPAMAELTPYGSVRVGAFYQVQDPAGAAGLNNITDTNLDLNRNSRVGIKGSTGAIGGVVELGLMGSSATATGSQAALQRHGVYTRLIYGTYKFDAGTLLIGQDYSNNWVTSAQVFDADSGFSGYGALDNKRQPQVKFTMNNGLYLAAISPTIQVLGNQANYGATPVAGDVQITVPELNIGYRGKAGNFDYNAGVMYLNAETNNGMAGAKSFNAYLGYVDGKLTSGPVSVLFNLGYGANIGDMGIASGALNTTANKYSAATNQDVITTEGFIQGSYQLSDTVALNAGIGYASDKKRASDNDVVPADKKADGRIVYMVNAPVTIAKGFSVTPELSYYDELKAADGVTKQEKRYAIGAKLQMDF